MSALRLWPRPLRALQVEVTSRCTRSCAICPRAALAGHWREGDMASEVWAVLCPDLRLARHVHLQGWGEPLLHRDLRAMVRDARGAGCAVGITTNGDLLAEAAEWIVAEGVELLTVSVAGDSEHHARHRDGSELGKVWSAVRRAVRARAARRRPWVQVSFLLTLDNLSDLPQVVAEAAVAGADELFVTHLDCTPSEDLLGRTVFADLAAVEVAAAARRVARAARIRFRGPLLVSREMLTCALDPLRLAFVGWDGRVGPCVNLLLPVAGSIPRWTSDGCTEVEPFAYGRVGDAGLRDLLSGERRRWFTSPFVARLEAEERFRRAPDGLWSNVAVEAVERADRRRTQDLSDNPFPPPCIGCHKRNGW